MSPSSLPALAVRILSAVVVGVATIFVAKIDPREHWSVPPTVELRHPDSPADGSGDPPPRHG